MSKTQDLREAADTIVGLERGKEASGSLTLHHAITGRSKTLVTLEWMNGQEKRLSGEIGLTKQALYNRRGEPSLELNARLAKLRAKRRQLRIAINEHPGYQGPTYNTAMGLPGDESKFAME